MVIASPPRCAGVEVALFYGPNLALGGLNGLGETGPVGVKARVTVAESGALRFNAGVGYGLYRYPSKHVYYLIWDRVGERGFVAVGAIAKLLGIRGEYAISILRGASGLSSGAETTRLGGKPCPRQLIISGNGWNVRTCGGGHAVLRRYETQAITERRFEMGRIIAMVILGMAFFAACGDDDATGPTATSGGEVELRVVFSYKFSTHREGVGYNFVKGQRVKITTMTHPSWRLGEFSDMDLWPGSGYYTIWAKPKRIYLENGEHVDCAYFRAGESIRFKLRALKDKARCEITIKNISAERVSEEYIISKFLMRYKMEIY